MNYIYDILCNFQSVCYDFFEWNKEDNVLRIRKIPIIKVSDVCYYDLKYNNVIVKDDLLDKIKNKTEIFKDNGVGIISYSSIFTNGKESVVIQFDTKGNNVYRSSMLFDEELEVIEDMDNEKVYDIEYNFISKGEFMFSTRKDSSLIETIKNIINKLYSNKENDKLEYLYFDCFNSKCTNSLKIKDDLINSLTNSKVREKIYNFSKLISKV